MMPKYGFYGITWESGDHVTRLLTLCNSQGYGTNHVMPEGDDVDGDAYNIESIPDFKGALLFDRLYL